MREKSIVVSANAKVTIEVGTFEESLINTRIVC